MQRTLVLLAVAAISSACSPAQQNELRPDDDLANLGTHADILIWTPAQQLAGYRNMDRIAPIRVIGAGGRPYPLPERPGDLSSVSYQVEDETFDLAGFRTHNRLVGLLVIQDGEIVFEEYDQGNTPETRWMSFSVAKSVVSLLMGAAIRDGLIESLDDPVTAYLPDLEGTSYENVTIRNALQMASGVEWNEDYTDPRSDVSTSRGTAAERIRFLGAQPRVAPPGARFNYNTGETHLVGGVLRAAVGSDLSSYVSQKIWKPFGMEADAYWQLVEPGGAEHGGCCISATLRDYGRIGLFALREGVLPDGTAVLPEGWMAESTTPSKANEGYGYLWWLSDTGAYRALGIFGQAIFIDPEEKLVIVTHGAWPRATGKDLSAHRAAFFEAVTEAVAH
jgi:CubicO group peptidase (beta-lactamase class C family)